MTETPCCLLCQHPELQQKVCRDGRQYFECENCHYLFLNPSQRLPLPAERERYLLHNNQTSDPSYLKYLRKTWDKHKPKPENPPQNVLDYGCGPTKGLEATLQEFNIQVTSYDPIFYPEKNWPQSGFDVVFCSEALEHAFAPAEIFSEWTQVLKPLGQVALRTQFHSGIEAIEDWWYAADPTHVGFFNTQTFSYIATRWNFTVEHMHSPYMVLVRK